VDKNVGILLERHNVRDRLCEERRALIDDLNDRVEVVEDYVVQDKIYRKAVIGLLITIGGLITWGMNLIPKAILLITTWRGSGA
jgi:hypothetical protein